MLTKRIVSILAVLLLLSGLFPGAVFANTGVSDPATAESVAEIRLVSIHTAIDPVEGLAEFGAVLDPLQEEAFKILDEYWTRIGAAEPAAALSRGTGQILAAGTYEYSIKIGVNDTYAFDEKLGFFYGEADLSDTVGFAFDEGFRAVVISNIVPPLTITGSPSTDPQGSGSDPQNTDPQGTGSDPQNTDPQGSGSGPYTDAPGKVVFKDDLIFRVRPDGSLRSQFNVYAEGVGVLFASSGPSSNLRAAEILAARTANAWQQSADSLNRYEASSANIQPAPGPFLDRGNPGGLLLGPADPGSSALDLLRGGKITANGTITAGTYGVMDNFQQILENPPAANEGDPEEDDGVPEEDDQAGAVKETPSGEHKVLVGGDTVGVLLGGKSGAGDGEDGGSKARLVSSKQPVFFRDGSSGTATFYGVKESEPRLGKTTNIVWFSDDPFPVPPDAGGGQPSEDDGHRDGAPKDPADGNGSAGPGPNPVPNPYENALLKLRNDIIVSARALGTGGILRQVHGQDNSKGAPSLNVNYGSVVVSVRESQSIRAVALGEGGASAVSLFDGSPFVFSGYEDGVLALNYGELIPGDLVCTPTFNGLYVGSVEYEGNDDYEADLDALKDAVLTGLYAYEIDHPEVFWLGETTKLKAVTVVTREAVTDYVFLIFSDETGYAMLLPEYAEEGALEKAIETRDRAIEENLSALPASGSPRDIAAAINRRLVLNNEYNTSEDLSAIGALPHRSLSALLGSRGTEGPVCDGYAKAFKVLCDAYGLPCRIQTGLLERNGSESLHSRCLVMLDDGNWYAVDPALNDPKVEGAPSPVSGYETEDHLLVGDEAFVRLRDVPLAAWYYDDVRAVTERGLMRLSAGGTFAPEDPATGADVLEALYALAGRTTTWHILPPFFDTEEPVTRERALYLLWRYAAIYGKKQDGASGRTFADLDEVSGDAKDAIVWAGKNGILFGRDGRTIAPREIITKAELAAFLARTVQ